MLNIPKHKAYHNNTVAKLSGQHQICCVPEPPPDKLLQRSHTNTSPSMQIHARTRRSIPAAVARVPADEQVPRLFAVGVHGPRRNKEIPEALPVLIGSMFKQAPNPLPRLNKFTCACAFSVPSRALVVRIISGTPR